MATVSGTDVPPRVMSEEQLRPDELAKFSTMWETAERNVRWYERHAAEIAEKHSGKHVCIAGGAVFAADTPTAAIAEARSAHPDEWGAFFTTFVTTDRGPKLNAH